MVVGVVVVRFIFNRIIYVCYDPNPNSLCERNICPQHVVGIGDALNALCTSLNKCAHRRSAN